MDLGFNLNLEQKQKLVMTPQLQMAIEILQFSSQEMEEYIEEELAENPLLDRLDKQNYSSGIDYSVNSDKENNYENYVAYKPNLLEHLERQLYQVLEENELELGKFIIGSLDEHGFLTSSCRNIAKRFKSSVDKVESILRRIQYLDPVGIAASNVREALLIQLDSLMLDTGLAERIVRDYFDCLVEKEYSFIRKKLAANEERVMGAINLIKTLNPHPASAYNTANEVKYIVPDLIVKENRGEYLVISNEKSIPSLMINPYYHKMLKENKGTDVYEYLLGKYRSALWLMRSIEQRRFTIYRIAEAIVKEQRDFLNLGIKYLKSMTMQEVADILGMHESTVSRATTEKYLQTPQGLFELKFFFNSGVNNLSSVSIKALIADYIENEKPESPLSDRELTELLKENRALDLSRRTVAKYRKEMGIPSSNKRRKPK